MVTPSSNSAGRGLLSHNCADRGSDNPISNLIDDPTTLQLAAGTQTYLQAQWVASWQFGYPEADFSFASNTFAIFAMAPQVAQAYLPTLTYLGPR